MCLKMSKINVKIIELMSGEKVNISSHVIKICMFISSLNDELYIKISTNRFYYNYPIAHFRQHPSLPLPKSH